MSLTPAHAETAAGRAGLEQPPPAPSTHVDIRHAEGVLLNYLVAMVHGAQLITDGPNTGLLHLPDRTGRSVDRWSLLPPDYAGSWDHASEIVDQTDMEFSRPAPGVWQAQISRMDADGCLRPSATAHGSTRLQAAARCYAIHGHGHHCLRIPEAEVELLQRLHESYAVQTGQARSAAPLRPRG